MNKLKSRASAPVDLRVEELEPRVLLSAGIESALFIDAANADLVIHDQLLPPAVATATDSSSASESTASVRREIVFVDAHAPDVEQLIAQIEAYDRENDALERDIVLLDAQRDGVEQIAETLVRYSDLDAVHVISHGSDGALILGNARLDADSLAAYRGLIGGWVDALDADADILFYGCDLAAGEDGRALIDALAVLTGADIAASTDVTGHASLGGDWDLEIEHGVIETEIAVSKQAQASWRGSLATATFQEGSGGYTSTQDTELRGASPDTSYGTQGFIDVQGNAGSELQGLLRFDGIFGNGPGQIPFGSTITAASLTIEGFDETTFDITFHRMLQPWSEASTFNSLVSGIQADDVEAQATPDATLVAPAATTHTLTGLETTLQAWSDGDANHGWAVLSTGTNDFGLLSSETGTVSERPLLQVTYTAPTTSISGTISEDVDGDGVLADAVGATGVDVDLYADDGDGVIDAGDSLLGSTTTDGSGNYSFAGVGNGTYWVVVDSTTIAASAGYNGGFGDADVWADQTYGSAGAVSFNGAYSYLGTAGTLYGGMQGEVADDASALTSAEHVTRVTIAGASAAGVDSAFSFNVVTRTGDGDVDPGNRTLQGSLRQFVGNSNAIAGTQSSLFVIPTSDSNYNGSGNGEYTINLTTGWDAYLTDTVILDATTQPGYSGDPIVELDASGAGSITAAFAVRANDSTVRGFIVHGSPDEGIEVDGSTGFGDNNTIQNNWIGLNAAGTLIGNGDNGFLFAVDAVGNLFGGDGPNDGNIVVGSTSAGVMVRNTGTNNNVVAGNYIGVGPDGLAAMPNVRGLVIEQGASNNTIGGATAGARNVISGNNDHGLVVWDATTTLNTVIGNYIGLDASGTVAVANQFDGIYVGGNASNNIIGGATAGEGNVISGNLDDGIEIGNSATTGNTVLGNYIGTNAAGTAAIGNGRHGVVIYNGANNTQIGGGLAGEGNVISGNVQDGLVIDGNNGGTTTNNAVQGNRIGTNASGTAAIANGAAGLNIFGGASNNQIGGSGAGEGNLISGNGFNGIEITGVATSGNVVRGNLIGTDISGTAGLGNDNFGLWIFSGADNNTIGGSAAGEANVIADHGGFGIAITSASGTTVQGNFIGTDAGGTIDLRNGLSGVAIQGTSGNTDVGGVNAGEGNVIAYNEGAGVLIGETTTGGISVLRNSIFNNTELGIDIVEAGAITGVTVNDALDTDGGANGQQNFPLLFSSNTDATGNVYVSGSMRAAASTTYRVEFFGSPIGDPSGHGQGQVYLGFTNVTTDGSGQADFSLSLADTLPAGYVLSTTATAPDGSTSEFSSVVESKRMGVLTVDTTLDSVDGNVASITSLLNDRGADGRISLREAMLATNATVNAGIPDEIHFNLQLDDPNRFYYQDDGTGGSLTLIAGTTLPDADIGDFDPDYPSTPATWFRLQPTSALPDINDALIIDGFTQDGASANTLAVGSDAVMKIVLDGALSGNVDALVVNAAGSGIHGMVITGDFLSGIVVNAANVEVSGNFIGTDVTGSMAGASLDFGVALRPGADNVTVGGATPASRNVISGTTGDAIVVTGATTHSNTIEGNYIGVNAQGDAAIANTSDGISLVLGTYDNVIRGNVISGNNRGIVVDGDTLAVTNNTIVGNLIGTDATGGFALANVMGVRILRGATNTTIGGTSAADRNIVSGNTGLGIRIQSLGTTGNVIIGNYIGTDIGGAAALANGDAGIRIGNSASGNTIGGTAAGAGNVISSNAIGIDINDANSNVIEGNLIGTDSSGTANLGNSIAAVQIRNLASNNVVGGTAAGAGNVIAHTSGVGVLIVSDAGTGNAVLGNAIYDNTGLGIEHQPGGLVPPDLATAQTDGVGSVSIVGSIDALPSTTYRIEFFANASGDPGGAGEGEVYLGFINVTTDGSGRGDFTAALSAVIAPGAVISATSTDAANSTSEFAANIVTTQTAPTVDLDADDSSGQGGSDFATTFTEDGGPVAVADSDAIVTDPDSTIDWMTVTITNVLDGALETLAASTGATGIVASYDAGTGVLTLSGTASAANYQLVLQSVTYNNASEDPNTTSRVLEIVANDGTLSSAVARTTISMTAINDAPVLTPAAPSLPTITEDDLANGGQQVSVLLGGSVTDVDSGAVEGIAITGLSSGNGTWQYSLDGGSSWLNVGAVANNSALLLRSTDFVRFVPDGDNADSASFTFRAWDQTSGSAGALGDTTTNGSTTAFSTATDSTSITVTAVNDAPVLTPAAPSLPTISEDDVANSGQQVSVLLGSSVTDVDSGAVEGIAITGLSSGNGTWQYSLDGGSSWLNVGAVANNSALLLRSTDFVRFVPDGDNADSASFTFRAWDQTSGSAGTLVDTTTNGSTTAFSAAIDTASITVTAVNDAPVLTPAAPSMPTITEDDVANGGRQVSVLLGGSVTDVDSGAVEGIAVTSLSSGNGTWQYSLDGGSSWLNVGAVANNSALLLRSTDFIRFVPDGENADSATFTFRGWDQTGGSAGTLTDTTTNGGQSAYSTATDTASITVTAVNDAPVLTPAAPSLPTITEDEVANGGQQVGVLLGGSVSDIDSGAIEGVAITALTSGNGTWQYSLDGGASWTNVGAVADSSALLLRSTDFIRFVPDGENADSANFTFRAWDQTNGSAGTLTDTTTNGGQTEFSTATDTALITVTAVNDAPVLTPAAPSLPTIAEDDVANGGQQVGVLLGGSVSDIDSGAVEGIAITGLGSGNGTWQYSLDGGSSWLNVGAVANNSALLLRSTDFVRFVPDGENADSASFTFRAWDQTSGSAGSLADTSANGGQTSFSTATDTASITITAVNDAPVLTPASPSLPTITEDDIANGGQQVSILLGGSVTDVDSSAIEGIAITGLSSGNGTWQYSLDGGSSWLNVGAVANNSALLLRSTDFVRFVPDGDNADSASFTFRAWDQTSGSAGALGDTTTNGTTTAFSTATDSTSITVTAVNDAPVLTPAAPSLPTITEDDVANGGQQVSILLGGSVTDVDSGAVEGIAITGLSSGNGTWQYSLDGGASWLNVGAVANNSALLLRSTDFIRFVPDGENADSANFTFRAWDQTSGSAGTLADTTTNGSTTAFSTASDTASITVTAVNDAPVLAPAAPSLPPITEDDVANGGQQVSVLLGGSVTDVDSGAIDGIAITALTSGNGTWQYSLDGGSSWLNVGAVANNSALLLRSIDFVRFVPDGENADSASLSFRAWDQTSGAAGTLADTSTNGSTTAYSTATDTASITVTAVNDAPVLTPASPSLPTISEDDVANSGQQVSVLLGSSVTDIDSGAVEGIAITGLSSGNGTWQYSLDGGSSWLNVGAVANNSALLLRSTDFVRFVPDGDNADSASFTFRAWDQTSGSAGSLADTTANGGQTPFSAATDTASITVTAVNDAPVLTPATPSLPTITEDDVGNGGQQVGTLLGGSVSDVDSGAVEGIAITALASGNGTWQYSLDGGASWLNVGAVANNSALLLRSTDFVRFVPDGQNADSASLTFRAWDQTSGSAGTLGDTTTNGSTTAFSTATDTALITVTAVNDAPVLTPASPSLPTITEDDVANGGQQVGTLLGGSVTDVDSGAVEGIAVTGLSSGNGTWQYSLDGGSSWLNVGAVANNSALLLRSTDFVRFVPDGENADSASFTFRAWDQTSGSAGSLADSSANGGQTPFSTAADSASITVTAVNDAPTITGVDGDSLVYTAGDGVVVVEQGADVLISDVDSTDFDGGSLTVSLTAGSDPAEDVLSIRNQGAGAGQIGFDGTNVFYEGIQIGTASGGTGGADLVISLNASATLTAASALIENVTYQNLDTVNPTTGARAVSFTLDDGDGATSVSYDATVNLPGVNTATILDRFGVDAYSNNDGNVNWSADWVESDSQGGGPGGGRIEVRSGRLDFQVASAGDNIYRSADLSSATSATLSLAYSNSLGGAATLHVQVSGDGGATYNTVAIFDAATNSGTGSLSIDITAYADADTRVRFFVVTGETGAGNNRLWVDDVQIEYDFNTDPVLTLPGASLGYTENDGPVVIDGGATVADAEGTDFDGGVLTVDITTGGTANDRLSVRNEGNGAGQVGLSGTDVTYSGVIVGTLSGGTDGATPLTITFNAAADQAAVQAVARNITYENVSDDPDLTARTVRFVLTDGDGGTSAAVTETINLSATNDAPVLTPAAPTLPTVTEDDLANGGLQVGTLLGASVSDVDSGAVEGIAITSLSSGNGAWQYSLDGGTTWNDVGAVTNNSALLLRSTDFVRFVPDGQNADSASFTFRAWDQTSGSAGTLADTTTNGTTTAFSTATDMASITVTALNDAPALTPGSPSLPGITEDDLSNGGVQVSTLLGASVSDVDSGAVEGIAIVSLSPSNGTWQYSIDGGSSWLDITGVAVNNALLLRSTDFVRLVPDGDNGESTGFGFRAWDQTSGTAGGFGDTTVNGGQTAFSSTFDAASITVTAVNDAPVLVPGAPSLPTIIEDDATNGGQQVGTLLGASVSDVDSGAVEGIAITSLSSGNGTWQYSLDGGTSWLDVGAVANNSALLLRSTDFVRFVPDGQNADSASFTFRAWDQTSGSAGTLSDTTTNGTTTAFSTATDTASITVTALNDAPALTPGSPSLPGITEDDVSDGGVQVSTLLGASVSDVDSGAVEGIAITSLSSGNGTWQYSIDGGTIWLDVGAVSDASALLLRDTDLVRFVPDAQNADSASFTFRAWDQTSGTQGTKVDASTNGGTTSFSTTTDSASITVTAVNDAPVLTPAAPTLPTITEDDTAYGGVLVSTLLGAGVSDVDSGAVEGIAITALSSGNGTWQYSLDGGTSWLDVGAVSDNAALLLRDTDMIRFVPDAQNADAASFTYRAWDRSSGSAGTLADASTNGGTTAFSAATDSASITVTAVNDAPVLTPAGPTLVTITEDDVTNGGVLVSTLLGASVSDVDSGAVEGIAITALSSGNGTWQYSTDGGTSWLDVGAVSDASALLLRDTDLVRFVPDAQNADTASFSFRAWDQTAGTQGTKVDASTNGGTTAFSTATDSASITVTAVNDAPVLDPAVVLTLSPVLEDDSNPPGDTVAAILASGGSDALTDVDVGAVEGIAVIGVDDSNGTWQYSTDGGTSWISFGAVSLTNAVLLDSAASVRFVPDAGYIGNGGAVSFHGWDLSAGLSGQTGVDVSITGTTTAFSTLSGSFGVSVGAVNDTPTTSGIAAVTVDEDAAPTVIDVHAAFDDVEDADAALSYTVTGNTNPSLFASLTFDATDGTLTLAYAPDANGSAVLTVRATDTDGAFVETSFTVAINPINDAPTTAGIADVSGSEDGAPLSLDLRTLFDDIEDGAAGLTFNIASNSNPALVDTSIDPLTGIATFTPVADANGNATLTIRATDTAGAFVEATFTLTLAPVNDAPTAPGLPLVSVNEDAPGLTVDLYPAFADIDDALSALTFTLIGTSGDPIIDAAVDSASGTLSLQFLEDRNGDATVTVRATDAAGAFVDAVLQLSVAPVDDAPSTAVPGTQLTNENAVVLLSTNQGNAIRITDPDGGEVTVTLSVTDGTLLLATTAGLNFAAGAAEAGATITFTGTVEAVNAALDGLLFQPNADFVGITTISISTQAAGTVGSASTAQLGVVVLDLLDDRQVASKLPQSGAQTPPSAAVREANASDDAPPASQDQAQFDAGSAPAADFAALNSVGVPTLPGTTALRILEALIEPDNRNDTRTTASGETGLADISRRLLALGSSGTGATLLVNDAVFDALDMLKKRFDESGDTALAESQMIVAVASGVTLSLSAGFVTWLMRAGALLTSLLSTTPVWRGFDPLPVLGATRDDEDDDFFLDVPDRNNKAEALFEDIRGDQR